MVVYLAMSAATSAEAVGIYRSVVGEAEAAVPRLDAAEAGVLDTKVTVDVDVLGVSFC